MIIVHELITRPHHILEGTSRTILSYFVTTQVRTVKELCARLASSEEQDAKLLDNLFFGSSPTQVAYTLGVIYALLMPAGSPISANEDAKEFQFDFIKSGCGFKVVELLTRNNFLSNSDEFTKM